MNLTAASPFGIMSTCMKLLLSLTDQSFLATKSVGIFNVSMGLVRGFINCPEVTELHLLGNQECAARLTGLPDKVRLHLADRPVPRRFARLWWDQVEVSDLIRSIDPDWAVLPKGFPPFFPRLGRSRLACYVHDVNWEYYRSLRSSDSPFPAHELLYFRSLGLRALKLSDLVLTSTQFNRRRFAAYVPGARTAVIGIGFDDPVRPPAETERTGILFFASPYPHKLTALGIRRLSAWLAQCPEANRVRIHVIGKLPQQISLPDERWIPHTRLPFDELRELQHSQCRVTVYFSAYEGFGMPPVESLRNGVACVASDLPPHRENLPAASLFRNDDEDDFIRCLNRAWQAPNTWTCPDYPTWNTVAARAVQAMQAVESNENRS